MYWGMGEAWMWGGRQLFYTGWMPADPVKMYAAEAEQAAAQSRVRETALSAAHPQTVFRLGVHYGHAPWRTVDRSPEPASDDASDRDLVAIQTAADFLGVGPVQPLPSGAAEPRFAWAFHEDVSGVASRVERATSVRLRHLFILGALAGGQLGLLESRDRPIPAPSPLIAEHGVVSGIPTPLWRALTIVSPDRATAALDYRAAVDTLDEYLSPRSVGSEK